MAWKGTARQKAALRKAQLRSAELRRQGHGKGGSTNFYGTGKSGRKAARRSTYGQRKHGLSIAQQQRRKQRANKWKRRGAAVVSTAATGAAIYSQVTTPAQRRAHKTKVKTKARDYGENVSVSARGAKMVYKVNRQMGHGRTKSAKAARPRVKHR